MPFLHIELPFQYAIQRQNSAVKTADSAINGAFMSSLVKKRANEKLIQISSCRLVRTPYNAPPLTRNNGSLAAGSEGFPRKS
jgi:hypothetical protein